MKRKAASIRRQKIEVSERGIRLRRARMTAGFSAAIDRAVRDTARRFKCSRRLVVAVAVASFLGLDDQGGL